MDTRELVLDLHGAEAAIKRRLESDGSVWRATVVEAEEDVARLEEQLVFRGWPGAPHQSSRRTAVDLYEHGVALRGVEPGRGAHCPPELLSVGRTESAKRRQPMTQKVRVVGMR